MSFYRSSIKPLIIYLLKNKLIKLSYLPKVLRIGLKGTLIFESERKIVFSNKDYFKISPMLMDNDLPIHYVCYK
jgi:hypothetical protein